MQLLRALARGGVTPVARRTIIGAVPAVAGGFVVTPENGRCWEVLSLAASLVSDSNAANRAVTLTLGDGNNNLWELPPLAVQVASKTYGYAWLAAYPSPIVTIVDAVQAMPLPPVILLPGWTLTVGVDAVQVGDQFGAPVAQVLETFFGATEAEYSAARAIEHHAEAIAELVAGEVPGI